MTYSRFDDVPGRGELLRAVESFRTTSPRMISEAVGRTAVFVFGETTAPPSWTPATTATDDSPGALTL